jgi:hypothetical protein
LSIILLLYFTKTEFHADILSIFIQYIEVQTQKICEKALSLHYHKAIQNLQKCPLTAFASDVVTAFGSELTSVFVTGTSKSQKLNK